MISIRNAESDHDIARCYAVMRQLRPHLRKADFVATVRRQMNGGYTLAFVEEDAEIRSVAGYRIIENLFNGRILYVDDLVSDEVHRSRGHGRRLFDWLVVRAREEGCATLELDSGVQRSGAHRFYFANGMVISSFHFRLTL